MFYKAKKFNSDVSLAQLVTSSSSLVASVGNRDQWKNNGGAGLNGNAIEREAARTNNG
jgi:hypothetical protein